MNVTGPYSRGGGFAYTYRLEGAGKQWAVRCFKALPDEARQQSICRFIETHPQPFFVPTYYLPQGVLVNGRLYPVIKMQWVQGQTLGTYVDQNVNNATLLHKLLTRFVQLVSTLEGLGIAHGDLQNGNVMVQNGQLMLVDYDGMYLPELAPLGAKERGHADYQHPARDQDFGPHLDRFSSIVIYLALKALIQTPQLWDRYSSGENLLFRQKDFISPDTSKLLDELEGLPGLSRLIQSFRHICKTDLARVPTLSDLLSGRVTEVLPERVIAIPRWGQYEVVAAEQRDRLLQLIGQRVTVVGQISEHALKQTQKGKPYVFLSFGDWRRGDFRLVIWAEGLQAFTTKGKNLQQYQGKWVSVTGLLSEYHTEPWPQRPQITVETPAEIEILTGGEAEAKQRLSAKTDSKPVKVQPPRPTVAPARVIPTPLSQPAPIRAKDYFEKGLVFEEQGDLNRAIAQYQAALKVDPHFAAAHYQLGQVYRQQGESDKALNAYLAAVQSQPDLIPAQQALGWLYGEKGRLDKTIQAFQAILAIDPNYTEAHFGLGWAYGQQGRFDKAVTAYKTTLYLNPNHSAAHHNLGWTYNQQGRLTEAIQELEVAAKLNPNYENTQKLLAALRPELHAKEAVKHCMTGLQLKQQQRWAEAIQAFAAALAHDPRLPEAHLGLIESYLHNSRWVDAEKQANVARQQGVTGIDTMLSAWQPKLSISETLCDFGEIPLGQTTVRHITVSNTGKGILQARIINALSWLAISPTMFTCESGDQQQITITIPSDICAGEHQSTDAFQIQSNGGLMSIGVHIKVIPPILAVEPQDLVILLDANGIGESEATITNLGIGKLEAKITQTHGFKPGKIDISTPLFFCQAGQSQSFKIAVHYPSSALYHTLPEGELTVMSNGGKATIRLKTQFFGPRLGVKPSTIDLGTYVDGAALRAQVYLSNIGSELLQGRIRVVGKLPWLEVKPVSFTLSPGESTRITLQILPDAVKLKFPALSQSLTADLQISSNGGEISIPVKMISRYLKPQ